MAGIRPTGSGPTGYPLQLGPTWGNSWPLSTVAVGAAPPYVSSQGAVITASPPFLQNDFPNPRPYPRAIDLRTWAYNTTVTINIPRPDGLGLQRDWPNPRGKPWPSDVRTGWIWQTPTALYAATYNYAASSKFIGYSVLAPPMSSANASKLIGYAVLIPVPYYVQRHWELPQPIPPGKWNFNRKWESGPPLPLLTTPYHPFGQQIFPDRFALKRGMDWTQNGLQVSSPLDTGFIYLICYN